MLINEIIMTNLQRKWSDNSILLMVVEKCIITIRFFLESKTPKTENINKTNITQYSRILKKLISRHNLIELSNVKNKVRNS